MPIENPVNAKEAAEILGGRKPWGRSRMSALKRSMGIEGRYFLVSEVRKFLKDNPKWTESMVYIRKPKHEAIPA